MEIESSTYRDLTQSVSVRLGTLRSGARDVMKSFGDLDETLGVAVYMGGGPSLMYAANAIAAFEEFSGAVVIQANVD